MGANIESRFSTEYARFREQLDNDQLQNLRARIKNEVQSGLIPENRLYLISLGSGARYHVYLDKAKHVLWFLGGHWIRAGEPSQEFMKKMKHYESEIAHGRRPF